MANIGERGRDSAARDFIEDCVQQANQVRKELEPQWYENWGNYRVESPYGNQYPDKQSPRGETVGDLS